MVNTPDPGLTNKQRRKLRRIVSEAVTNVPWYQRLYGELGLTSADLSDPSLLGKLPVLTKNDLLEVSSRQRVSSRFDPRHLTEETTTGSTGQPFSVYIDNAYKLRRNARFYRGLLSVGYRPWHRIMLLTDRYPGTNSRFGKRFYVSVEQPTEEIAAAYLDIQPDVLYGFATPLQLLASQLEGLRAGPARPQLVISTAEMLDAATRQRLAAGYGCPIADFYGMTEMGLVAWQRPGSGGYIMSRNTVLTEFVPENACPGRYRMLMTNLDLHASPIIRFDSGDLAAVEMTVDGPVVTAFEGRVVDTIIGRDGSEFSPYRITDALRDVDGLKRFRVVQKETALFSIEIEAASTGREEICADITKTFEDLMGPDLKLDFTYSDSLISRGDRKFRPVASEVARP